MLCAAADAAFTYTAYRFDATEGWHLRTAGNAGASKLDGRALRLDFTQGAPWIALGLPDRVLLGKPTKFHLRVRGAAKGHPVRVTLHTHFMTFTKVVGEFTGDGEQELAFDAPPGHDWQWHGGENDGKIHGPLRFGELRFEAGTAKDATRLELIALNIDGTCPADRLCLLTAATTSEGGQAGFTATLRAATERVLDGDLTWRIRDWDGRELARGRHPVKLLPGGGPLAVNIPAPSFAPQLRFAEAEFTLAIPGQTVPEAQAYWLAPVTPYDDPALRPESPFGMGVYLNRFHGTDQEAVARAARDAGVKWSREDFSWGAIERAPGQFDFAFHDRLLEVARANGITVYAIVGFFPSWSKAYTSEGVDQYVAFLRVLVKRYQDRIKQWEIWNEPNIFFWDGPKELYAECLIKSHAAIKEIDPTADVLGISTAGIDYRFIEQMLAKGTPFDVLTIHPYRKVLEDAAFIADLKKVSDLVKLPDGRRRPVWLTELGWATHTPHHALGQDFAPNSQRTQAELLARTYLCAIASGVEPRTFWYDFRNDGDDPIYFEHNMGIVTRDLRPKPAYVAFLTLARVLKGMRFAGPADVTAPDGTFAFRFTPDPQARDAGRAPGNVTEVLTLWNPKQAGTVNVPLAGGKATLWNAVGETRLLLGQAGKLEVALPARQAAYLVVER